MPTIEAMTARNRILALSPETVAAFSDTPPPLARASGFVASGVRRGASLWM